MRFWDMRCFKYIPFSYTLNIICTCVSNRTAIITLHTVLDVHCCIHCISTVLWKHNILLTLNILLHSYNNSENKICCFLHTFAFSLLYTLILFSFSSEVIFVYPSVFVRHGNMAVSVQVFVMAAMMKRNHGEKSEEVSLVLKSKIWALKSYDFTAVWYIIIINLLNIVFFICHF